MKLINFPEHHSIGKVLISNQKSKKDWDNAIEAKGKIRVSDTETAELWVDNKFAFDMSFCNSLKPDDLDGFIFASSRKFDGSEIEKILHLSGLTHISLWETRITDEILKYIPNFSMLRVLDVGDTEITDYGLSYLKNLSLLKELSLLNNNIRGGGLSFLTKLKLTHLDLMKTDINDDSIQFLRQIKELEHLRIFGTQISEKGFFELRKSLPDCEIRFYKSNDL